MNSILIIITLQGFLILGYCQDKWAPALVVSEFNGQLSLTTPINFNPETKAATFKAPQYGKTYLFCNTSETLTEVAVLHKVKEMQPLEGFDDAKKCEDEARIEMMRVNFADNVINTGNTIWDPKVIEYRQSGYVIQPKQLPVVNEVPENEETQNEIRKPLLEREKNQEETEKLLESEELQNESDENLYFFTLIHIFHHKEKEHTVSVQYELRSTDLPYHETIFNIGILALFEGHDKKNYQILSYAFSSSAQYVQLFRGKISEKSIATLSEKSKENPLTYLLFANTEHFPLPIWRRACTSTFNVFPIWRKSELTWNKVDTFARIVAKHLGHLMVTAGITGEMTLSGEKFQDKNGFQFPNYFWKAFQGDVDGKSYGIIVVLNYNPFEKTEKKLCDDEGVCENNGWIVANDNFQSGEIYCCKMTKQNFASLDANYLRWEEKEIFNLHQWEHKSNVIKEEYVNDISHKENPFKLGLDLDGEEDQTNNN